MMNNHYRNHQNQPKARAIAASQAAEQDLLRKVALFATVTISSLLLLLLINP
ncbi:MAG: hypothetical protein OCD03_05595 [Hyphomicrobiales bacterium]